MVILLPCYHNLGLCLIMNYKQIMGIVKLENARRYIIKTYGQVDVNLPDLLLDVVNDEGMLMVSSDDTIDVEDIIYQRIDLILHPERKSFYP